MSDQRYAQARFLLNMGPMPPPTPQELAAARFQYSLDHDMFAHGHSDAGPQYNNNTVRRMPPPYLNTPGAVPPPYPFAPHDTPGVTAAPSQNANQEQRNEPGAGSGLNKGLQLEVHVPATPVTGPASTQATVQPPIRLAFRIEDTLPGDFLSRVCANMNLAVADAQLGWKSSDDTKKALPHPLRTEDDVHTAFEHFRPILLSKRRQRPIWMEIINLASVKPADKAPPPEPKATETAYRDELNTVKTALACEKHRGKNRWCFVRRDDAEGPRCVPLGLEEVTLWARKLHEDKAKDPEERVLDDKCLTPPDVLHLDDLVKAATQRNERNKARKGKLDGPEIHVHMPPMLGDMLNLHHAASPPHRQAKRRREESSDDELSDDDSPAPSITDVLTILHHCEVGGIPRART